MEIQLNTLYVVTRGSSIRRDHLTLQVVVERKVKLAVPVHQLESVAAFGGVHVTPGAMGLCADNGVAVNFLTESGRLRARVDAPGSGNVLLRREQFRLASLPDRIRQITAQVVAGKIHNCRNLILRGARETDDAGDRQALQQAAARLADAIPRLPVAESVDSVRGYEGDAARNYFAAFPALVRNERATFAPKGRSRRPPLDPMNALLSFLYGMLLNDCVSAAAAAGLDPNVGFLHVDRPGRPGLALDLMEEFRALAADRLALALVNRQQVKAEGFTTRDGGSVEMNDATRRIVLAEYHRRKREELMHPLLAQKTTFGRMPFLQARILARHIRGDLADYVPFVPKN